MLSKGDNTSAYQIDQGIRDGTASNWEYYAQEKTSIELPSNWTEWEDLDKTLIMLLGRGARLGPAPASIMGGLSPHVPSLGQR